MRRKLGAFALRGMAALILVGSVPAATTAQQSAVAVTSSVFDDVTVVDVEQGGLRPAQRVVVVGNRIKAVGSRAKVKLPKAAQVVDARGTYMIPGLWDMHTHLWGYVDVAYTLYIVNGVTGIRDVGTGIPLDSFHRWRAEILAGQRVGPPRQLFAGPMLGGGVTGALCRAICAFGTSPTIPVNSPEHARHVADSLKAAGADFLKLHGIGSPDRLFALIKEAKRIGIPFAGHLEMPSVVEASDSGQRTIEHGGIKGICLGDGATVDKCAPLARHLAKNNTWEVLGPAHLTHRPKQGTSEERWARLDYWPYSVTNNSMFDLPWVAARDSGITPDNSHSLHLEVAEQAGLPLMIGTDLGPVYPFGAPGFSLLDDLQVYVEQGLSPLAGLRAVTLNPAKFLGATDSLGTVAPGKLADFVLLGGNPLEAIANVTKIRAVVANGRYYDRATLDSMLMALRRKATATSGNGH